MEDFYTKYSKYRDKKKLTDYQVSKATGIPMSSFTDWKNGRCKPRTETVLKLAKYFGVRMERLL